MMWLRKCCGIETKRWCSLNIYEIAHLILFRCFFFRLSLSLSLAHTHKESNQLVSLMKQKQNHRLRSKNSKDPILTTQNNHKINTTQKFGCFSFSFPDSQRVFLLPLRLLVFESWSLIWIQKILRIGVQFFFFFWLYINNIFVYVSDLMWSYVCSVSVFVSVSVSVSVVEILIVHLRQREW